MLDLQRYIMLLEGGAGGHMAHPFDYTDFTANDLIELVGESLTLPGEGKEVGPTLGINKQIIQGLYMAPSVIASAMKVAILTYARTNNYGATLQCYALNKYIQSLGHETIVLNVPLDEDYHHNS